MSLAVINPFVFAAGAAFSPSDLTNLQMWHKTDAGVTLGTSPDVSDWADQSGNSVDFTQSSVSARPHLVSADLNGLDGILFDGSNDSLDEGDVAAFDGLTAFTCSFVFKPTGVATAAGNILTKWSTSGSNRSWILRKDNADIEIFLSQNGSSSVSAKTSSTPLSAGTAVLVTIRYDGAGATDADKLKVFIDGGSEETLTFSGSPPTSLSNGTSNLIMGRQGGSEGDFTMYEIVFYSDAKSVSDRGDVESYLQTRYGL